VWRYLAIGFVCCAVHFSANSQSLPAGVQGWKPIETPVMPQAQHVSVSRDYLLSCSETDQAGVQAQLSRAAENAGMVEGAISLTLLLLTHDEGGTAEQKFLPALLKKAETGAKIVEYWDKLQLQLYGRSTAKSFKVCQPLLGTLVVVPIANRNLAPPAIGLPNSAPSATLPRFPPVTSPLMSGVAPRTLAPQPYVLKLPPIPPCTPYTANLSLIANTMKAPWIAGRAVLRSPLTGAPFPSASQVVSIFSGVQMERSCLTGADGTFFFSNLASGSTNVAVGLARPVPLVLAIGTGSYIGDVYMP
jgi:hypothetical protein